MQSVWAVLIHSKHSIYNVLVLLLFHLLTLYLPEIFSQLAVGLKASEATIDPGQDVFQGWILSKSWKIPDRSLLWEAAAPPWVIGSWSDRFSHIPQPWEPWRKERERKWLPWVHPDYLGENDGVWGPLTDFLRVTVTSEAKKEPATR